MKKTIITITIVVAVLLLSAIAIPLFFKQNIIDATKSTINKSLNAEVDFSAFNLSLFRRFPKVALEIKDLTLVGDDEFKNDTLFSTGAVNATMSLSSLFKKSGIVIDEIIFDNPKLNLLINANGKENWNLISEIEPDKKVAGSSENGDAGAPLALQLNKIEFNNARLIYTDKISKTEAAFSDINLTVSGKMYGTATHLNVAGKVKHFNLKYDNVGYISNISLETKSVLNIDYETMKISILENQLFVNNLALELSGGMGIQEDSTLFDMQIKSRKSGFNNFLALVPPSYDNYLKDIKTSGSAAITGYIKGFWFAESYPSFLLKMNVDNGTFQYAELPDKIKNIKADVAILKPQGVLNLTGIEVKNAHAEVKNSPVDFVLKMNNLVNDPWFDGAFVGKLNFDNLKDVLPLDSVNIAGVIDANLFAKGNYSAIENEAYDKIKSDGTVLLNNFVYTSPKLSKPVFVPKGELVFSPRNISLKQFSVKVGQSDFNLSGSVANYLNYIFKGGILSGNVNLHSKFTNLNELFRLQIENTKENVNVVDNEKSTVDVEDSEKENLAFTIPENIDITFRSQINRVQFDQLPITNVNGLITAKNGKLILNGLNMNMLQGSMRVNGSYKNSLQNQPFVDFGVKVADFDIPTAYRTLSGFRSVLPGAGSSSGTFSSNIKIKGRLTPEFKFIPSSINGKGDFTTRNLQIVDSKMFNQLKGILKADKLKNVKVDDFTAHFTLINGNVDLRPFKTKVAGQETSVKAALSVENLINMRMDFNVKREAFGPDIQKILELIPGNEKIKVVPAGVIITGPVGNPEVKMDLAEARKAILNATKDDIKKSINDLGKELFKLFK